ncbi:MAG: HAD family hydrolase [Ideonella sp.]|nr:HAD family hydrolase [Ideonella sp.]
MLADATVEHLRSAIRVAGLRRRLLLEVAVGRFDQYRQDILAPDSWLQGFAPQAVVLSLSARPLVESTPIGATAERVGAALSAFVDELRGLWSAVSRRHGCVVVQQTFLDVFDPVFGSHDLLVPAAPTRLVAALNGRIVEAAADAGVLLLDVGRVSARDGIDAWFDPARWLQGKLEIAPQAAPWYGELVARVLAAQRGLSRKCLVLDLDNTLWGGVVGEVGVEGIVLGEGSALGEAYRGFQRYAKVLADRGVVLAVCSKNDAALAEAAFRDHPEMLLRRSDIAAFVANWSDKAENLRAIAEQLNIGLDSLVFIDDNPAERARVRESLPMVAVPELPEDPALYVRCIAEAGYFDVVGFTAEDRERSRQYGANTEREALRASAQTVDEFLRGLEMTVVHGPLLPVDVARATQLLNKTNQFNTTTRRYTAEQVAALSEGSGASALQFRLADRLGDNGLVSVMVLVPAADEPDVLEIENWVMSCRVFGRQLEHEAMNILVDAARSQGVRALRARYHPTERNAVVRDLYPSLGFAPVTGPVSSDGSSEWQLHLGNYAALSTCITRRSSAT